MGWDMRLLFEILRHKAGPVIHEFLTERRLSDHSSQSAVDSPANSTVAMERDGMLALASPPVNKTSITAISRVLSVTQAFATDTSVPPPLTFTFTLVALPPVLMNCTAIEPSTFLKAATLTPDGAPDVPRRTAPGRTNRLMTWVSCNLHHLAILE